MKETTRKQIEAMKAQTIGVEIEMYNITRQNAAKAAADFFGSRRHFQLRSQIALIQRERLW